MTYSDFQERVTSFVELFRKKAISRRSFCVLIADTSVEYIIFMTACVIYSLVIVPIHGALDEDSIKQICYETNPQTIFVDEKYAEKLNGVYSTEKSRIVFVRGSSLYSVARKLHFVEVIDIMSLKNLKREEEFGLQLLEPKDISAVLYTSGSTGRPKGAIFTEELMLPSEGFSVIQPYIRLDFQAFDPSLMLSLLSTFQLGGCRALVSDLTNLMEDFQKVRPTHIGATPIFWNALHKDYISLLHEFLKSGKYTQESAELEASSIIRKRLGNRLYVATSGGAPLSEQVLQFAKDKLKIDLVNLYGSIESGGITRDGVVYPQVDVKLLSIPELGYFSDGTPSRGEICVASPRLIPGYFNNEELNKEKFVIIDGKTYYRTGDVGELFLEGKNRILRVIDRTSFVFKLSQGEWITPSRIESILEQCPYVKQSIVLGAPDQPFCVSVIVPSPLFFEKTENMDNEKAKNKFLLKELKFWCQHYHLRPIEIPQAVHIKMTPWSEFNGLLTGTEKKVRNALSKFYEKVKTQLYK